MKRKQDKLSSVQIGFCWRRPDAWSTSMKSLAWCGIRTRMSWLLGSTSHWMQSSHILKTELLQLSPRLKRFYGWFRSPPVTTGPLQRWHSLTSSLRHAETWQGQQLFVRIWPKKGQSIVAWIGSAVLRIFATPPLHEKVMIISCDSFGSFGFTGQWKIRIDKLSSRLHALVSLMLLGKPSS